MSRKNKEQKTDSFFSSFGYYVVIVVLVLCLGFVYVQDHSKRKERESYRESLMKDETAEKIGSIEVVEPVDSYQNQKRNPMLLLRRKKTVKRRKLLLKRTDITGYIHRSKNTQNVRDNVLGCFVVNSVWLNIMNFQKEEILFLKKYDILCV